MLVRGTGRHRRRTRRHPVAIPVHHPMLRRTRPGSAFRRRQDRFGSARLISGTRFTAELEETLTTFATAPVTIAITGMADRRPIIAAVAVHGKRAILAVQSESRIAYTPVTAEGAPRAAVGLLPALRPGPGGSITFTTGREPAAHTYLRAAPSAADPASRAAQALLSRPRLGGGSFLISTTTPRLPPDSISWLDTDAGRHAVTTTPSPDGALHTTYTPADQARISHLIARSLTKFT
ncbi:ESX secretion-associated protein EspG [Actinokineospora fastidiosa]|uniref:ESX secretion-associated protein EspG n=1 Tax=Actinokineospora fastidiosa TaxID=1816 RepID=UPI00227D7487|nr:ESX secretion-associated protein EspG [Actinokineospora fastidiosa]